VDILATKVQKTIQILSQLHKVLMPCQWLVVQVSLSKIVVFQENKLQVMKIQCKQGTFPQYGYYGNMSSSTVIQIPEVLPR